MMLLAAASACTLLDGPAWFAAAASVRRLRLLLLQQAIRLAVLMRSKQIGHTAVSASASAAAAAASAVS
jgi:hypothetical protein